LAYFLGYKIRDFNFRDFGPSRNRLCDNGFVKSTFGTFGKSEFQEIGLWDIKFRKINFEILVAYHTKNWTCGLIKKINFALINVSEGFLANYQSWTKRAITIEKSLYFCLFLRPVMWSVANGGGKKIRVALNLLATKNPWNGLRCVYISEPLQILGTIFYIKKNFFFSFLGS